MKNALLLAIGAFALSVLAQVQVDVANVAGVSSLPSCGVSLYFLALSID
jgi:hypothetical protein